MRLLDVAACLGSQKGWRATNLHHPDFREFDDRRRQSWSRARRVVAQAEQLPGQQKPRYLVTSLDADRGPAQPLSEQFYWARGERENRIKEQWSLFADRRSTQTLRANQLRRYLSSLA